MDKTINILHLEDDDNDAMLIHETIFSELTQCKIKRVSNKNAFEEALINEKFDLILSDFALPSFDGLSALKIAKELAADVPYIYVSGYIGEERAIEALKMGATDYVLKDKIIKLLPAINRALSEHEEKEKNKLIRRSLKVEEEKFLSIVNNFPVVLFMTDNKGVPIFSQGKGFIISGIKSEELLGKNLIELYKDVPFELLEGKTIKAGEAFAEALKGNIQNGIIYLDGRYDDTKLLPYYNEDNKISGIIGILHDITDLVNTRNKLRDSEELYRSIFESAPIGMARISPSGNYLDANIALQKMLGYDENEFRSLNISDVTFDDDKVQSKTLFNKVISNELNIVSFEKRYRSKSGDLFWTNLTSKVVKDSKGKTLYLLSMLENINDKKLAALALRESEKRFKDLAELLPQTVFEANINMIVTYLNQEGLVTFQYSEDDLSNGIAIQQVVYSKESGFLLEKFAETLRGKLLGGIELMAIRKDGSEFPCLVYARPIIANDKAVGLRGILLDITKNKQTLEELIQAKEKAEEMSRLKSNFLANMSHELRTPLIGILGFSDILRNELSNSQYVDMIEAIFVSGNRLLETLNLILDLSKIESDSLQINNSFFNLIDMVNQTIESLRSTVETKGLYIELDTALQNFNVNLDERMCKEVIENLINNGVKFTAKGGVIIKVEKEITDSKEFAIIKIIDTGIGIPEESQKLIFEEFRQVSEGYSRKYEGAGLGLTITKHFVEKMNGIISLESESNKGTVFTIKLPSNI